MNSPLPNPAPAYVANGEQAEADIFNRPTVDVQENVQATIGAAYLKVTPSATPDDNVNVAAGRTLNPEQGVNVVELTAAAVLGPFAVTTGGNVRYDAVILNSAGTAILFNGITAASPGDPRRTIDFVARSPGYKLIALIKIDETGTVVIDEDDIVDMRYAGFNNQTEYLNSDMDYKAVIGSNLRKARTLVLLPGDYSIDEDITMGTNTTLIGTSGNIPGSSVVNDRVRMSITTTGRLTLADGCSIEGVEFATTTGGALASGLRITGSYAYLKRCTFAANSSPVRTYGIEISIAGKSDVTIEDCVFEALCFGNMPWIYLTGAGGSGVNIRNNQIDMSTTGGKFISGPTAQADCVIDIDVHHNNISMSSSTFVQYFIHDANSGWKVHDNFINSDGSSSYAHIGVHLSWIGAFPRYSNCSIHNNIVEGDYCKLALLYPAGGDYVSHVTITGNVMQGASHKVVEFYGGAASFIQHITISDNIVDGDLIYNVTGNVSVSDVTITGNVCLDGQINVTCAINRMTIDGNIFSKDDANPIISTGSLTGVVLDDNLFMNTSGDAVELGSCDDVTITGNYISGYEIEIQLGTATNIVISNNYLEANSGSSIVGIITLVDTDEIIIEGNVGIGGRFVFCDSSYMDNAIISDNMCILNREFLYVPVCNTMTITGNHAIGTSAADIRCILLGPGAGSIFYTIRITNNMFEDYDCGIWAQEHAYRMVDISHNSINNVGYSGIRVDVMMQAVTIVHNNIRLSGSGNNDEFTVGAVTYNYTSAILVIQPTAGSTSDLIQNFEVSHNIIDWVTTYVTGYSPSGTFLGGACAIALVNLSTSAGIHLRSGSVSFNHIRMTNNYTGASSGTPYDNTVGIYVGHDIYAGSMRQITISNNSMYCLNATSTNARGIWGIYVGGSDQEYMTIESNIIFLSQRSTYTGAGNIYTYGITTFWDGTSVSSHVLINSNTITLEHSSVSTTDHNVRGIFTVSAEHCTFNNNTIKTMHQSGAFDIVTGIDISGSVRCTVVGNTLADIAAGTSGSTSVSDSPMTGSVCVANVLITGETVTSWGAGNVVANNANA